METNSGNHRVPPTLPVLELFKLSKLRDKTNVRDALGTTNPEPSPRSLANRRRLYLSTGKRLSRF